MGKAAALYLRSSKDRHDVSITAQREELSTLAAKNGDRVVAEFVDKVESAKTANRPAFQDMMGEVKAKNRRFQRIYCYDTSRFARRQYDAQIYKHLLRREDVDLLFLKLPKTDTFMDKVVESLMEIFDEFHSQKSKMDGLRGMRQNVRQGWRAGGRALTGYRLSHEVIGTRDGQPITKSKLVPDPKTFEVMRKYLKGRARGESRRALVEKHEIPIPYPTLVYLEDSALTYAGHTVWNRHSETIDGKPVGGKRYRDRSEWVIKRDTHEAMITDAEAEAILSVRAENNRKRRRRNISPYLLTGILHCGCDEAMDGNSGYYRCRARCGRRSIKQETLESAVMSVLLDELLTEEEVSKVRREAAKKLKQETAGRDTRGKQLAREHDDLKREISELVRLLPQLKHRTPVLDRIDELESERESVEKALAEEPATEPDQLDLTEETVKSFVSEYRETLGDEDADRKKALLQALVERAVLEERKVTVSVNPETVTGAKLATPAGLEPALPP